MVSFLRKHLATMVVATVTAMVAAGSMAVAHDADGGGHDGFAHKSGKVDGHDANDLSRAAFAFDNNGVVIGNASGTVLSTDITAPKKGFLIIQAGADWFNFVSDASFQCFVTVDGLLAESSLRFSRHDGAANDNEEEDCSTETMVPVQVGVHTITYEWAGGDVGNLAYDNAVLIVHFVPFNAFGGKPTNFTVNRPGTAANKPSN